jgi:HrpA-like RNA helicase
MSRWLTSSARWVTRWVTQALIKLPVHPRIGKMLILGSALGCPQPMLTIGAAACQRDPFMSPMAMRTQADKCKKAFSAG